MMATSHRCYPHCGIDLVGAHLGATTRRRVRRSRPSALLREIGGGRAPVRSYGAGCLRHRCPDPASPRAGAVLAFTACLPPYPPPCRRAASASRRSEEHTSELQSLMRISYAVFCLKKKNEHK